MMAQTGNIQLVFIINANADQTIEGIRLFSSHREWMERTHHRDGDKALLNYNVAMAPEMSDPLDPTSEPTGNTNFILSEVYESPAGVEDHFKQGQDSWSEFSSFMEWMGSCKTTLVPGAPVMHSLW